MLKKSRLPKVTAPVGFVTDLASIPQIFWSILRPDGDYAYAAILHDYMYWQQDQTREISDETFFTVMKNFGVDASTAKVIYLAVRTGGGAPGTPIANSRARERNAFSEVSDRPNDYVGAMEG